MPKRCVGRNERRIRQCKQQKPTSIAMRGTSFSAAVGTHQMQRAWIIHIMMELDAPRALIQYKDVILSVWEIPLWG